MNNLDASLPLVFCQDCRNRLKQLQAQGIQVEPDTAASTATRKLLSSGCKSLFFVWSQNWICCNILEAIAMHVPSFDYFNEFMVKLDFSVTSKSVYTTDSNFRVFFLSFLHSPDCIEFNLEITGVAPPQKTVNKSDPNCEEKKRNLFYRQPILALRGPMHVLVLFFFP